MRYDNLQLRNAAMLTAGGATALLTDVELTSIEGRLERWIRFGRVADEHIINRRERVQSFRPGMTFALICTSSSDFGTVRSSVHILTASAPGVTCSALPFVRPGAEILLRARDRSAVDHVLEAIDSIEAAGIDPCDVSPDHWRHLSGHLAAGIPFRRYTAERHAAWLRRKAMEA